MLCALLQLSPPLPPLSLQVVVMCQWASKCQLHCRSSSMVERLAAVQQVIGSIPVADLHVAARYNNVIMAHVCHVALS